MIRKVDRDAWVHLAHGFLDYNYRQSWDFGSACAVRVGALSEHIAIEYPGNTAIALADVRIRKLPLIGGGIAYINGGPLIRKKDLQDGAVWAGLIKALVEEYVLRRKLTLRIAPPLQPDQEEKGLEEALIQLGFFDMAQKKKTILIDLCQDEAVIRKQFHQKWRNCLNKSEKTALTVRAGRDHMLLHEFVPLFNGLVAEKKFSVDLDINFYLNVQLAAPEMDRFYIMLADLEGKPVAGHVASILGNTCVYLLGAADTLGRDMNAAYLLQWHAIRWSKAAGCRWYDLGGIAPEENPGVYTFKKRMGGEEKTISGPYQMHPVGVGAMLTRMGERIYTALKPYLVRQ